MHSQFMKGMSLAALGLLVWSISGRAQVEDLQRAHSNNLPWVEALDRAAAEEYRGRTDVLLRPGLVADRNAGTVTFYADGTGIGQGAPVEYFLTGDHSGHGYETVATSFARPSAVREGLIFIGMDPGRPVSYKKLWLWPKGERVAGTVTTLSTNGTDAVSFPLEHLLQRHSTGKSIESSGLVFVGSEFCPDPNNPSNQILAADHYDPGSIVSDYNDPWTVLDIPYRAAKGDVYSDNTVNDAHTLELGQRIRIVLRPQFTNGHVRVRDLHITAVPRDGRGRAIGDIAFIEHDLHAGHTNRYEDITGMLGAMVARVEKEQDPFVRLGFADELQLGACRVVALLVSKAEGPDGIRMEPPADGSFYYRAFMPNEAHRDYKQRYAQPLELYVSGSNRVEGAYLRYIEEHWPEDASDPEHKLHQLPLKKFGGLAGAIANTKDESGAIFVYAAAGVPLGELTSLLAPVRATHPLVHFYIEEAVTPGRTSAEAP